jgi:lipoprotein NlpI
MRLAAAGCVLLALLPAGPLTAGRSAQDWELCRGADADAAIAGCSRLARSEKGDNLAIVLFDRGNAWRSKDQPARAIDDYSRAIALMPDFPGAFVNRGIAWYQFRQFEKAIADYDQAIRLRPGLAEAWNNRALAWHKLGNYPRAKADFDRTIQLNQNYGNALINRALPSSPPLPGPGHPG